MIEIAVGLFLALGAYALGTQQTKEPEFDIELCAKSCERLKEYDHFKQRCICDKESKPYGT